LKGLIEEFNPQLKYIPGHKNIVADTLSHLEINDVFNPATSSDELFGLSKEELSFELPKNAYPLSYKTIFTSPSLNHLQIIS